MSRASERRSPAAAAAMRSVCAAVFGGTGASAYRSLVSLSNICAVSVRVEDRGAVRVVTLDRPQARNAIDDTIADGLHAALVELDGRADLHAAVVTGAGATFCAGMDLKAFADRPRADAA